ncbi:hypothetical protein A3844_24970 [Paenibacillus helianthi]|uniref:Copper amine oxidase-like N-terminal domain-containing protein n=1 Tax=Paenibacillus helianthi TaxID=1349432 RepID=A0ABX3EHQ3_9BACL|nr:hypothetical protein [Paenibacillus helianthi]OKP81840.1 hypothetical protein A3844_24970 [Paenibacillus helianthi]
MKKKIIGIAAAALLLGGSIGFAAASSPLIGAKVTGLFTLQYTDKTKIADAVIINGSAYVPVRKLAEATGTELTVEGKTITLEDKASATVTPVVGTDTTKVQERITALESRVKLLDEAIAKEEANIHLMETQEQQEGKRKYIEDLKTRRTEAQTELTQLKAQLGE